MVGRHCPLPLERLAGLARLAIGHSAPDLATYRPTVHVGIGVDSAARLPHIGSPVGPPFPRLLQPIRCDDLFAVEPVHEPSEVGVLIVRRADLAVRHYPPVVSLVDT